MAKITIFGETGELKTITGTFSKICEVTTSYADEQKFVDAILNTKNVKYKRVYFEDSRMESRTPIYGKDIKKINQILKNQEFIKKYLFECPRVFSDFVRKNVKTNRAFYINTIYKTMQNELDYLRDHYTDEYYNFLIELIKNYNDYLSKQNDHPERIDYAMYVQRAYDNLRKENEERFGQKEQEIVPIEPEIESDDEEEKDETLEEESMLDEYESKMETLYSFFKGDYIDDSLSTLVISNDFDAKKQLSNILDKCGVDTEYNFSKYNDVDFIILIGNDIRNDIKHFMNYGKPILAISLDKRININDDVVEIINDFDEEKIVEYLIKMQHECNKVRHYG